MTYQVHFGSCTFTYLTLYHAEQLMRALDLNGTPYTVTIGGVKL